MKTYKEYYNKFYKYRTELYNNSRTKWWKYDQRELDIQGDYIETVIPLSLDEKNNSPFYINHTNVENLEWSILFDMLGQILIDWCIENDETDIWSYKLIIDRTLIDYKDNLKYNHIIIDTSYTKSHKQFNDCSSFLCDIIYEFIKSHGKNIPNDWNHITFTLDNIKYSCSYGYWTPPSDGSFSLGNYDGQKYEEYVTGM